MSDRRTEIQAWNRKMVRSQLIRITDELSLGRAVVSVTAQSTEAGLSPVAAQQLATVVSELARNILKYAGHGQIEMRREEDGARVGIRLIVSDRGPGIDDVEQAVADHFSTGGSLGLGLSGVKRMMDEFHIESQPGKGTRIEVVKWR
jgi:serine/threonine-protein kinase RsbT